MALISSVYKKYELFDIIHFRAKIAFLAIFWANKIIFLQTKSSQKIAFCGKIYIFLRFLMKKCHLLLKKWTFFQNRKALWSPGE
jgi:hypothetical protein